MYYLLTVRKHQVKDYVQPHELTEVLKKLNVSIEDYSFHTHGKYQQLHLHALVYTLRPYPTKMGDFRIYWRKVEQIHASKDRITKYIHSDDHQNHIKLDQILVENKYQNEYNSNW